MASGCGDVLSLQDLKTAKLHQIFEAEVITGLAGGAPGGASIDYATNQATGQVQKTMPAILRDLGFSPASFDFNTGGTLTATDRNKAVLWPLASGGDGDWYYWEGALPKVIPAASTPAGTGGVSTGAWRPVGDITFRGDLISSDPGKGDALVRVLQPYTGAVNRTQHDKNMDSVSAKDFGATGNGTTDDYAAIQAALNTAKQVFLPAGTYVVSQGLVVPSGGGLFGESLTTTVIKPALNVNAVTFSPGRAGRVERLAITYSGSTSVSGIAIDIPDGAMSTCVREIFVTAPATGIRIGNCQGSSVENFDCWYFLNHGIHINDNFNDCFFDKIFLNGAVYNSSTLGVANQGIYTQGKAHAMFFSNVEIIQCNQPLNISGSSATNILTAAFSFFVNCFFDSSSSSVAIGSARNIKFIGCWFSNRDAGVALSNTVGISFQSCQFVNNSSHGAIIQTGCSYTKFLDCIFDSNGQQTPGTFHGIVSSTTSFLDISHCTFGNLGTFSATQQSGVYLLSGVESFVTIADNVFSPTLLGAGIFTASTGASIYIRDNQNFKTRSRGQIAMSSGTSLVVAHQLAVTPDVNSVSIGLQSGHGGITDFYVSATTSTTFTITTNTAPTSTIIFRWSVDASNPS